MSLEADIKERKEVLSRISTDPSMTPICKQLRQEIQELRDAKNRERRKHTFQLTTTTERAKVNVKPHPMSATKLEIACKMIQFPVNCNDTTTGHKLQGMSKDVVIITSWPCGGLFKNWEYVVLSRVRTHEGLYLFQKIPMDKSFAPCKELKFFFRRIRRKEKVFRRQNEIHKKELSKIMNFHKSNETHS